MQPTPPSRYDTRHLAQHQLELLPPRYRQGIERPALAHFLRKRAFHEAGHGVVAVLLYGARVVKSVSISPAKVGPDCVQRFSALSIPIVYRRPTLRGERSPIPPDGIVDAEGVYRYAGTVAEQIVDADQPFAVSQWQPPLGHPLACHLPRAMEDREQLEQTARTLAVERPADHYFEEYEREAERLLRAHWSSVERVAAGLLERGAMHGDRVDAAVLGQTTL